MQERRCRQCGSDLRERRSNAVLCGSDTCRRADMAQRERARYIWDENYRARSNAPKGKCTECSKPIHIKKSTSAANPICRECRRSLSTRKPSNPPAPEFCADCNSATTRKASKYDGKRYCLDCAKANTVRRDVDKRRRRRALNKALPATKYKTSEIAARDNYRCGLCGLIVHMFLSGLHERGPTIDHKTPISWGGSDTPDNVQLAHRICNLRKGARMESQ